jgi:hypothetical protein
MKEETRTLPVSLAQLLCSTDVPRRYFEHRNAYPHNMENVIGWVDDHFLNEFPVFLIDLDSIIDRFNSTAAEDLDPAFQNAILIKGILGDTPLPPIVSFTLKGSPSGADGTKDPARFKFEQVRKYSEVIRHVTKLMEIGDLPSEERGGRPFIGYQNTEADLKTLAVATIFQVYEEMAKASPGFADKEIEPDRIIEALMEVSTMDSDMEVFEILAGKKGMNWVDSNPRFSPEFRKRHHLN